MHKPAIRLRMHRSTVPCWQQYRFVRSPSRIRHRRNQSQQWNIVVLLLPGCCYLVYRLALVRALPVFLAALVLPAARVLQVFPAVALVAQLVATGLHSGCN